MDLLSVLSAALSPESQTLGTWIAATGAFAAWLTVFLEVRRRQVERQISLKTEYDELFDSRETFWSELRHAYKEFRLREPSAPQDLEGLIRAAGHPPGLGKVDLVLWPASFSNRLGPDQRTIWAFSQAIYPPRDGRDGRVTNHGLIAQVGGNAEEFHKARAAHAKLWNKWAQILNKRYLCANYVAVHDQWIILSWMEIALTQWTRNPGRGKVWLFELAQCAHSG